METIGTLVGGISHEFNNLLVVIVGHVEFGLQDTKPNEPIHRDLRRIENAASQARDLINQLLSFSRQQVLKPEQLDFNNCVEEFIKIWERIIGENILLQTKLAAKHAHIWADPLQVQQVLMNLSINARDAMPQGGKLIFETRNVEANKIKTLPLLKNGSRDYLQIKIIDTGLGIDEETQVRIFEPFYTTKEVGKGTGLGLSVVYGIVKHHKGHIEVSSKKGKGTTFTIYFPVINESKAKQSREKKPPNNLGGNETILVVEDEEAVRNVTTRLLKRLGYSVLTANNGEEALKMFETQHKNIDLVILDVILPNSDGSGIYPRMRSINPNLSILFVTGYDVKAELDKLRDLDLELEPIRIFQKPLTQEGLGTRVREILHA